MAGGTLTGMPKGLGQSGLSMVAAVLLTVACPQFARAQQPQAAPADPAISMARAPTRSKAERLARP